MKRFFCFLLSACLLCTALVFAIPTAVSAQTANIPDDEFSCAYSVSSGDDYVIYGSTEIIKMTASEAEANGVPSGYTDNVLQVKNGSSMDMGILLDFSSLQIPIVALKSITFRVWVGDEGVKNNEYPEVRIPIKGSKTDFVMRYNANDSVGEWVDITISNDGTNFYNNRDFSYLADGNGYLDKFGLCLRCKFGYADFYIDSITYELIEDDFACEYQATPENDYVHYGSKSITKMTAAEAIAKGVPAGFSGNVLQVENGGAYDMGILLDFSSLQIPINDLESITFRVWVGDDGANDGAYPEIRIPKIGSSSWIMRYDISEKTGQWVDITLYSDGTNFYNNYDFSYLANEDGNLGQFGFCLRCNASLVDFYIDSITYRRLSDEFACQYGASADTGVVQYGSTEINVMNSAQAAANGVPNGYRDRVLQIHNGTKSDMGILVDFSSHRIPVAALESISFRVWVGNTGITDTSPEIRISTLGETNWIMRYYLGDQMGQWVNIVLTRDGDNFQSQTSFSDLADGEGYLDRFCLAFRNKSTLVDFYIDSITYQLVNDTEAPLLSYTGEQSILAYEGEYLDLNVSAVDAVMGEIEVEYLWSDPAAINADGTLNRGDYTLTLTASDYFGNTVTKVLTVRVGAPDLTSPEILVTADVMYLVTGTSLSLNPQATDNSGRVRVTSYWSQDALDEHGRLNAGVHLYTVKAVDYSGNQTVKSVVVYVADDEYLGDNVINEANPPTDSGMVPLPSAPTPAPSQDDAAKQDASDFFRGCVLGAACSIFLATLVSLIVWYVKKRRNN